METTQSTKNCITINTKLFIQDFAITIDNPRKQNDKNLNYK